MEHFFFFFLQISSPALTEPAGVFVMSYFGLTDSVLFQHTAEGPQRGPGGASEGRGLRGATEGLWRGLRGATELIPEKTRAFILTGLYQKSAEFDPDTWTEDVRSRQED